MRKIFYKIIIICILISLITCIINLTENISKAATYKFNLTGQSQANQGDTLTFTITADGLTGNVKLSGSNVNLSSNQIWVEKNTVTFTAKIIAFPASVTATPVELTDNDYNIVSISPITKNISEIKKEEPPKVVEPENNNNGQTDSQGNQGQNNQGQNNQEQSNQNLNNQGKISGTQKDDSVTKNNNQKVTTSINNQENIKSSNNYLKNLTVSVGTLSPEFYRETFEYTIDNIIENEIEIGAEAEDEKSIVNGIGTIALIPGENIVNIEVIAENEQVRLYKIIINKVENIIESDLRLESLEIQTISEENKFEDLDIGFNKDVLDYRVTVDENVTDLSIMATVGREGIIIETEGEKNLKEGENVVKITLTNQNNNKANTTENINLENTINDVSENEKVQTTYIIKVTRKAKPIIEISNNLYEMQKRKIMAGIILALLFIILISIIVINLKHKEKTKKFKKRK